MASIYTKDPLVAALRRAGRRHDWPAVVSFFDSLDNTEDVTFFARLLAEVKGTQTWLAEVAQAEPASTLPRLLLGYRLVQWAWEARGAFSATDVSAEGWRLFFARLTEADDLLFGVLRTEPDNVAAWAQLIVTSRGLQRGIEVTRQRFDSVVARCPHHYFAHYQMLTQLCAKWGGSHAAMFEFARAAAEAAPPATPLGALVAEAHIERWFRSYNPVDGGMGYFRQAEVKAEVVEAAARSTGHPDFRLAVRDVRAVNMVAFALGYGKRRKPLRGQLRLLHGQRTEFPWAYRAGPATFAIQRSKAHLLP